MYMLQGLMARTVTATDLAAVWVASLLGNLAGSIGFAALVNAGGTLAAGGAPGKPGPGQAMVAAVVKAKDAATGPQLFWRAVLCNMLVCLALWMAGRTRSDGAKLVVLWWGLLAFIASGFEHSVANMTVFGLGVFGHVATWDQLWRNLAWTVPGNIVGGGLLVGVAYAWVVRPVAAPAELTVPVALEPPLEVSLQEAGGR
jgi:nitrite transporter NirC